MRYPPVPSLYAALLLPLCFLPLRAQAPSAEALLARHVEALGGWERLQSHTTRRLALRIKGVAPFTIPVILEKKRPGLIRKEVSLFWKTQITAFDGKDAWRIDPWGKGTVEELKPKELAELLEDADFDGPLVDAAAKGHRTEYLGVEHVGGRPAHMLAFTFSTGQRSTIYLDAATFLEVRRTWVRKERGRDQPMESAVSDYRVVDGILLPFRVEIGPMGSKDRMLILFDRIEENPPLADGRFRRPQL